MRIDPAFLFDLDGTLVDSVYQHVLAWKEALDSERIELSVWRIHRRVGMSGGLLANQLLRETGIEIDELLVRRLCEAHAAAYLKASDLVRALPGARELLAWLSEANIPWAIATSGRMETAAVNLAALGLDPAAALGESDAYSFFAALDDTIVTGFTGNNLRDLRLLLADP